MEIHCLEHANSSLQILKNFLAVHFYRAPALLSVFPLVPNHPRPALDPLKYSLMPRELCMGPWFPEARGENKSMGLFARALKIIPLAKLNLHLENETVEQQEREFYPSSCLEITSRFAQQSSAPHENISPRAGTVVQLSSFTHVSSF